ncbi:hypothetical protein [Neorhizobium sp. LjRoot104]|uniref:hypothetical protein n=1 Tax=Neorhizobium sp. LjRoot104 TaxID=3342254 RepID=UPI003ECE41BA
MKSILGNRKAALARRCQSSVKTALKAGFDELQLANQCVDPIRQVARAIWAQSTAAPS